MKKDFISGTISILVLLLCIFTPFVSSRLYGQDADTPVDDKEKENIEADPVSSDSDTADGTVVPEEEKSLVEQTLAEDINSATYYDLVLWCRQLAIDDTGDLNALRAKIFDYYKVKPEDRTAGDKKTGATKKVEIKSANKSEYFSIESVDEDYLLLEGNVLVEVYDLKDNVKHSIKAHRITINQTKNILTAEEDIEYVLTRGSEKPEIFKGESFSFSIDTWEGVFYSGAGESEKEIEEGKKSNFVFMGDTISRLTNDTVILDQGTITSDTSPENPYWMIKAKKIWVLAPGEWAIQDAVLYVGKIPVLYIPFLFYPGDELFFHPVIGYRDREGNFLQTTTYLAGEKKKKNSPFSFLRVTGDDAEEYKKEIKGLFLRTTNEKKTGSESTQPQTGGAAKTEKYFKVLLDLYSRLGGFLGVEGDFSGMFKIKGGVALSRDIFPANGSYSAYYVDGDGNLRDSWNTSSIFGIDVPVRYALETNFTLQKTLYSLTGKIEFFSDPYFPIDFYSRTEDYEITEAIGMSEIVQTAIVPVLKSTLNWTLNSTLNLSSFMPQPYIQGLTFSRCNIDFSWQSRIDEDAPYDSVDPSRQFFYPDRLLIPDVRLNLQGTLLSIPFKLGASAGSTVDEDAGKGFRVPEVLTREEGQGDEGAQAVVDQSDDGLDSGNQDDDSPDSGSPDGDNQDDDNHQDDGTPPVKQPSIKENTTGIQLREKGNSFTLTYAINPEMQIENQFLKTSWVSLDDVDFSTQYTHFIGLVPLNLSYMLGIWGDFIRFSGTLTMGNTWHYRYNISDTLSESIVDGYRLTDYTNSGVTLKQLFLTAFKPFLDIPEFSATSLEYRLDWYLYKYHFDHLGADDSPYYMTDFLLWEKEYITDHSARANIIFKPGQNPFTLYFYSTLPPRLISIDTYLEFPVWLFSTRISSKITEVDKNAAPPTNPETLAAWADGWVFDPVSLRETFTLGNIITFSQDLRYDVEGREWEDTTSSLKLLKLKPADAYYLVEQELVYGIEENTIKKSRSALYLFGFQAELLAEEMKPLEWEPVNTVWIEETASEERLLFNYFNMKYTLNKMDFYFWKYRIKLQPSVVSSFRYYFEHFTDSEFTLQYGITYSIKDFIDLTISAKSYNKNIYRYIPDIESIDGFEGVTYINPLVDLFRSFNIFNTNDRRASGFKLDSLSISFVHHLYDWDLSYTFTGGYSTVEGTRIWSPSFSIFVEWKPIPQIKKEFTGDLNGLNIGD